MKLISSKTFSIILVLSTLLAGCDSMIPTSTPTSIPLRYLRQMYHDEAESILDGYQIDSYPRLEAWKEGHYYLKVTAEGFGKLRLNQQNEILKKLAGIKIIGSYLYIDWVELLSGGILYSIKDGNIEREKTSSISSSSSSSGYSVRYEVTGRFTYNASMTYSNSQGGTEQVDSTLPFSKTFDMEYGDFAYISAQNKDDSGSISCKIYLNNVEWRSSTSEGAYVIASCSGSVGDD